jgi:hypothetical protein
VHFGHAHLELKTHCRVWGGRTEERVNSYE